MTTAPTSTSSRPVVLRATPLDWLKKNLFSNWYNSLISVLLLWLIGSTLYSTLVWAFTTARWPVIPENLKLFMTGLFPDDQLWRVWLLVGLICALAGLSWGILARNVAKLFSNGMLFWIGAVVVFSLLVPTPLPNRMLLLAFEALVLALAWGGRRSPVARLGWASGCPWPGRFLASSACGCWSVARV